MNLPFFIARRYLFSYKGHHAINIISRIAVVGVAVTTMALVCTLSVFNGFQELVASLFTSFDPELKVVPAQGKVIAADDPAVTAIRSYKDVAAATECLEGQALVRYGNRQSVVRIKGVDDNYSRTSDLSKILYGDGDFALKADVLYYGTPGLQLAAQLGLGVRYEYPLEVYAPRRGERISMVNPMESFNRDELHSPGVVFSVNQKKYDGEYILTSIDFTRRIFEQQGCISSLELKLKDGADIASVQKELGKLAGTKLKVLNRYEQQEDVFRIMRVEKLVAYIFLTFILVIACFNIIGSLSMLDYRQARRHGHAPQPRRRRPHHRAHILVRGAAHLVHRRGGSARCSACCSAWRNNTSACSRRRRSRKLHSRRLPRERTCVGHSRDIRNRARGRTPVHLVSRALPEQTAALIPRFTFHIRPRHAARLFCPHFRNM